MGQGQSDANFCCDPEGVEEHEAAAEQDDCTFQWLVPRAHVLGTEKGGKLDSSVFRLKDSPALKLRFFPRGFRKADDGNCSLYVWSGGDVTMELRVVLNGFARLVPEEGPEQWSYNDCKGFHNFCPWPQGDCRLTVELVETSETFLIMLDKTPDSKYGMQTSDGGDLIRIHAVRPGGLIARWNMGQPPHLQVVGGDCIVGCNGVSGDSNLMKAEMQMDVRHRITIRRARSCANKAPAIQFYPDVELPPPASEPRETAQRSAGNGPSGNFRAPSPEARDPGPISSSMPRPALAKMSTKEFREVRDQAKAGVSGIRYLPTHIKTVQVLVNVGMNRWCAANAGQAHLTDGVAYRYSKNLKHIVEDSFLRWGETIKAYDEGDGWVKFSLAEEEFEIELHKDVDDVIGIDTMRSNTAEIFIERVQQTGLIADWNKINPSYKVCAGDCIVAVNGVKGHSGKMMNKLKARQAELKIKIRRPVGVYDQSHETIHNPEIACEIDEFEPDSNAPVSNTRKPPRQQKQQKSNNVAQQAVNEVIQSRLYLPISVEVDGQSKIVMFAEGDNVWRVSRKNFKGQLAAPGLAVRASKNVDDVHDTSYAVWDSTLRCVDEGDGWLRILDKDFAKLCHGWES